MGVQASLVQDLDDWPNTTLGAYPWCRCGSERAISEEQRRVVGLGELCSFADSEWADAHSDRDGRRAGARHVCALDMLVAQEDAARLPLSVDAAAVSVVAECCAGDGAAKFVHRKRLVAMPTRATATDPDLASRELHLRRPTPPTCLSSHPGHQHLPGCLKVVET